MSAVRFPDLPDAEFPQTPSAELMHAASMAVLCAVDTTNTARDFFAWAEALFKAIGHFSEKDPETARRLAQIGEYAHDLAEDWFSGHANDLTEAHNTLRRLTMKDRP